MELILTSYAYEAQLTCLLEMVSVDLRRDDCGHRSGYHIQVVEKSYTSHPCSVV